jgi:hypothetical protein
MNIGPQTVRRKEEVQVEVHVHVQPALFSSCGCICSLQRLLQSVVPARCSVPVVCRAILERDGPGKKGWAAPGSVDKRAGHMAWQGQECQEFQGGEPPWLPPP